MTDKEELTRGGALARVAVLEAELAELRKRVCVPEGWMVVPSQCTSQMEDAYDQQCADDNAYGCSMHLPAYEAMLAAAPAPVERNWPEDAEHENGEYFCRCAHCGNQFIGHKRRVVCKACSAAPVGLVEQDVSQLLNDLLEFFEGSGIDPGNDIALRLASALTTPQPAAPAPDVAGLEREAETERQIQRACEELPEGWTIQLELENGAGYAVLYNPEGVTVDYDDDFDGVAGQIAEATDFAIAAHQQREGE
ncbi:MAG: hypothetical protein ABGX82_14425 [Pseudomonas sp.]|uniref:hypothetical protein n=1 Tax=Pseudomonas sp. TaxID=306 RepID=UPI003242D299